MKHILPGSILILVIIILIATGIYNANNKEEITVLPTPTPDTHDFVPTEFTSGNSRFSQGSCTEDADCIISGCSSEVCGNEEMITTCEFREDFPNKEKYDCGCVNNVCGWSN